VKEEKDLRPKEEEEEREEEGRRWNGQVGRTEIE